MRIIGAGVAGKRVDVRNFLDTLLAMTSKMASNVSRKMTKNGRCFVDPRLEALIVQGEGTTLEFKRCGNNPERDVFETVCSFANRQGGSILLGVLDDGTVEGVSESSVVSIERNLANVACNHDLFNVAPALECERFPVGDGRAVIRVWVPMGPSLYSFKGEVYDRRADADVRVTGEADRAALLLRKSSYYTEAKVYPWVTPDDLEPGIIAEARDMIAAADANHPWLALDDDGLLRASRLITRDPSTGDHGLNLAAILLLGREETILDVLPAYRTEALLRRRDTERYDDRLSCTKNLIRAYDELVGFCERWTPDAFVLDGAQRVSARDVIVRELVANCLVHREFTSPRMASVTIGRDGISTENASRALWSGSIDPDHLSPTPKNPIIARFFTQIGRAEELGSGTRKLWRYSLLYAGGEPRLEEGDVFRAFAPLPDVVAGPAPVPARPDEVRAAVEALSARGGSFASSELVAAVGTMGERTVRRRLAAMVESGELEVEGVGRATRYRLAR